MHENDAFICYRRSDGSAAAHWLRAQLQSFKLPRGLAPSGARKLSIYLDSAYERSTTDFYEQEIRPALLASKHLIVVSTPDALNVRPHGRDWILREIEEFEATPRGASIVAVRGAGALDDPLPGALLDRHPNIEIVDLRGAS